MSVQDRSKRLSVTQIRNRKGGDKLVCLTAYTSSVARLLDNVVDLLLVGDSLAMTVYGFDSTLSIGLDTMIAHGAAVVRSTERREPLPSRDSETLPQPDCRAQRQSQRDNQQQQSEK